jgi:D-alanyl-D-alanine carboxypeptidase/D-alanyl-D-alanine-endopeptidase (penicillin-binding protein 4)
MANQKHLRQHALTATICGVALLLALTLTASRTFYRSRAAGLVLPTQEQSSRGEELRQAHSQSSQPPAVSTSSSAAELGRNLDRLIDESEFREARWGVFVMSLKDGRVLYSRNADKAIAPASNLKLYTTAVALDLLGADYRWRTSVYVKAEPDKNGTIAGDLTLYGRGAPDLSSVAERGESLSGIDKLADEIYKRGVRSVRGSVVGDESYFRGDPLGDGWLWNDVQWYFGAEVSALSVNDNEVDVAVTPNTKTGEQANVKLKPETPYVSIENDTRTAERTASSTIGITRGLSDNTVRVWGDFPIGGRTTGVRLAVHQPALWAATLLHDALRRRGITIEGRPQAVDARDGKTDTRIEPEHAVELASVSGKTLGQIIHQTNKESVNLYAELILRTLGRERGGNAPASDRKKMRTRGDDETGIAVVRQWLEQHSVPAKALALHDGSGLSRLDLVTPEATARLLAAMNETPSAAVFRDSLPIAGRDGTLKFRLRSIGAGKITAKTGTLTYINSLSGYAATGDDQELLVFSIICNDEVEAESSTPVIDAIAASLASYQESGP